MNFSGEDRFQSAQTMFSSSSEGGRLGLMAHLLLFTDQSQLGGKIKAPFSDIGGQWKKAPLPFYRLVRLISMLELFIEPPCSLNSASTKDSFEGLKPFAKVRAAEATVRLCP